MRAIKTAALLLCCMMTACTLKGADSPLPISGVNATAPPEADAMPSGETEAPLPIETGAAQERSDVMKPTPSIKRQKPWADIESFICYYGEFTPDMGLYDVAILESRNLTADRITWLRSHGTYTIAYISVGEDDSLQVGDGLGPGGYASYYMDKNGEPSKNGNWNSYFVNAGSEVWQAHIIEKAGQILAMGCDGLFLDTIDTAELYPETRTGMAELIRRLKETYPDAKIVANRGMFMLADFAPYIAGMMFEDFTGGYDFARQRYKMNSASDLTWTKAEADKINQIRQEHYFPVFALDYADPEDLEAIQTCYDRAWEYDFIPNVSVIQLNRVIWRDIRPQTERGVKSGLPVFKAETTTNYTLTGHTYSMTYNEYDGAFMNPLKGFRANHFPTKNYETLVHVYFAWDELESIASDGVDKIRAITNERLSQLAFSSTQVIPRVYLDYPSTTPDPNKVLMPAYGREYYVERRWPEDMTLGDYDSPAFAARLEKLIEKMGQAWDDDPRIAYVEMGLIGFWGEQHMPEVSPELQQVMGDAFTKAFPHKKVMVRRPQDFADFSFGIYWDSFAHADEHYIYSGIRNMGDRWKTQVFGGETAYDWGSYKVHPGESPDVTLKDEAHRVYLTDMIRTLHVNHLGWVADYNTLDEAVAAGAAEVQKVLGYRFVIRSAEYTDTVQDTLEVRIKVENTGSSPFYYDWPIEFCLIKDGKIAFRHKQQGFALSSVMPGDDWDKTEQRYRQAPLAYEITDRFDISGLAPGDYMLCVGILDPGGGVPNPRFANESYTVFGKTALGWVGVGAPPAKAGLDGYTFASFTEDDIIFKSR